tara:strand:- start:561 stop:1910 length:1350 start_codon:yes stop_codon:yes gene_type:complete
MNKKKKLVFFLLLIALTNCSFDDKTGIWDGSKDERERISELKERQSEIISVDKLYSSENVYKEEKSLIGKIKLSSPKKNLSWEMHALNHQNFLGNIYLSGIDSLFLKKKIGKNKFSTTNIKSSPLIYENNIFISDDTGTVFSINQNGKIQWKKNIYKKIYKKIYKNLTFSIYKNNIYVADNIGFIYCISLDTGKLVWIKNHGIPFKSKMKTFDDKVYLINQDNRLLAFNIKDGSVIWDIRSISSFIKSQNFLSVALSKKGDVIASGTSGDLFKVSAINGNVNWSINTLDSLLAHSTDFFSSSDIVIGDENIIFSTENSIFSFDLNGGFINWTKNVSSVAAPIIDNDNIFFVTENGYFVIANIGTGEIISSTNILKILKKKKQSTKITGFIMGSGNIYSVTMNGYLIVSSASSGKTEKFKKIGDRITSSPIINNGKLFIYTENSRIFGFN